ncbi:MAG: MerR family transcriptional regulator, partial [Lachnospiraceae bacterium]|nr:MerR family transcriptional regulator [Lachnospiraceae bacterium]
IHKVLSETRRVLRDGGRFICSAYGSSHMQEITQLVQEFDPHIVLSADRLYERFGLDNGRQILEESGLFDSIELCRYEDSLIVTQAQPLIEYILSCHGNQNRYLINRYREFRLFVEDRVRGGLHITKDAGAFTCR